VKCRTSRGASGEGPGGVQGRSAGAQDSYVFLSKGVISELYRLFSPERVDSAFHLKGDSQSRGHNAPPEVSTIAHFIRSYAESLLDFSSDEAILLRFTKAWLEPMLLILESGLREAPLVKYLKHVTVYPLAKLSSRRDLTGHTKLPEYSPPFGLSSWFFGGAIRRFIRNRLNGRLGYEFGYSVLQGVKRGTEIVPKSMVEAELKAHGEILGQPPKSPFNEVQSKFDMELILAAFFEGITSFQPSFDREITQAASYSSTRGFGGARGELQEQLGTTYPELISITPHGYLNYGRPKISFRDLESRIARDNGDLPPILVEFGGVTILSDDYDGRDPRAVGVVPILEPLKVRVITKTDAAVTHYARPLQSVSWSHNFSKWQFSLTGTPLVGYHLYDLDARTDLFLKDLPRYGGVVPDQDPHVHWVSGDYKGATDRLDIRASRLVFENMLDAMGADKDTVPIGGRSYNRDYLRMNLFDLVLYYSEKKNGQPFVSSVKQQNGQLMGSVLSFPLLCVCNYLAYFLAILEYYAIDIDAFDQRDKEIRSRQRREYLKATRSGILFPGSPAFKGLLVELIDKIPVLINGDDILFRCTSSFYPVWKKYLDRFGFVESLGKNYVSQDFLTVNSKLFIISKRDGKNEFRESEFFNCGLLTGALNLEEKILPFWDHWETLAKGCRNPERTWRRFLHYHVRIMKPILGKSVNPFIPRELGGLGFYLPPGLKTRITPLQEYNARIHWSYVKHLDHVGRLSTKWPGLTTFSDGVPKNLDPVNSATLGFLSLRGFPLGFSSEDPNTGKIMGYLSMRGPLRLPEVTETVAPFQYYLDQVEYQMSVMYDGCPRMVPMPRARYASWLRVLSRGGKDVASLPWLPKSLLVTHKFPWCLATARRSGVSAIKEIKSPSPPQTSVVPMQDYFSSELRPFGAGRQETTRSRDVGILDSSESLEEEEVYTDCLNKCSVESQI